jgi:hypothetical protein
MRLLVSAGSLPNTGKGNQENNKPQESITMREYPPTVEKGSQKAALVFSVKE